MRFNFKWIVAIGLLLAVANVWWERSSSRKDYWGDDEPFDAGTKKVHARESTPLVTRTTTATVPAPTWHGTVNQAITSGSSPSDQAKNLLAQFPNLPPAGQFEAAHHISNMLPNDSYGTWAGYLTNAAVSPETQKVIYADLLHRPNSIKLPLLLELARSPTCPQTTDAAQLLRAILREDHGSDWEAWSQRIQAWLKNNPD
jgi:hypothetical protein